MSIIGAFSLENPNHKRNETLIFGSLLTVLATIVVGLTTVALGKKSLHLKEIIAITAGAGGVGLALTVGVAWAFRRRTDQETGASGILNIPASSSNKETSRVSRPNNGDVLVVDGVKVKVKKKISSGKDGLIFSCVRVEGVGKKDLVLKLAWNGDINSTRKENEYCKSVLHEYEMMQRASELQCAIPALDPIAIDGKWILMPQMDGDLFSLILSNKLSTCQFRRVAIDLIQSTITHHKNNIVHGDLTFGNILYHYDENSGYEFRLSDYADAQQSTSDADRANDLGCLARGLVHLLTLSTNKFEEILTPLREISGLGKEKNYNKQLDIANQVINKLNALRDV